MNTNCDMLPFVSPLVHTHSTAEYQINARNCGKALPFWAKAKGGLNWY